MRAKPGQPMTLGTQHIVDNEDKERRVGLRAKYRQFYETIKRKFLWFIFYRVGYDIFNSLATIILAIATSALAMIAVWQWSALNSSDIAIHESAKAATDAAKAAKDSVRLTRDAMRLDQRAWIGVSTIDPVPSIPSEGKTFTAKVNITNSGKTPARNIISVGSLDPLESPKLPDFSYTNHDRLNMGTLAPGAGGVIPFTALHDITANKDYVIVHEFLDKLINKQAIIYVSGRIDYDDIFGQPHWTTYCAWLTVPFNGQFARCETHNETDDYKEAEN
jgi:hypothetical protein